MNVNFEYAKTLAGVGSLLLLLSVIPNAGLILGIIGAILLVIGVKELANYFQDRGIYQSALSSVKFYIVALLMAEPETPSLADLVREMSLCTLGATTCCLRHCWPNMTWEIHREPVAFHYL